MTTFLIFNIFFLLVNICVLFFNRYNLKNIIDIFDKKDMLCKEQVKHLNDRTHTINNFYHTKVYEYSLTLLKMKQFHLNMIEFLDPVMEKETIELINTNIQDIEEALREISFLNKISPEPTSNLSIIEKIYIDESKFSKN